MADDPTVKPGKIIEVRGGTSLYGRLMQVGGLAPRATLLLRSGKLMHVDITEAIAVEMASGGRLYEEIGLEGEATWRADTWEMIDFKARCLLPYRPDEVDLVRTFRLLGEAANGRWDSIDAREFVRELRSEDQG